MCISKQDKKSRIKKTLRNSDITQKRYDRIAPFYDLMEVLAEKQRFSSWRRNLRYRIFGKHVLEVGVGTGKNLGYYPDNAQITAIDLSPSMIHRAQKRAKILRINVDLRQMDVQQLQFPDQTFDTVFATFVFCSVPDPILGLKELRRVCKPGGRLLLLEHMRPGNLMLGHLFDLLNPMVVRMMGANINRRTLDNIYESGWNVEFVNDLFSDIVRWIEARP